MKKKAISILFAFLSLSVCASVLFPAERLILQVMVIDPTISQNPQPKSPVVPPSVSIDGHTLYLYSGCAGATLQVVDGQDEVVYTTEIPDEIEEIELPETLVGEYELQILRGNFCFYATIEL